MRKPENNLSRIDKRALLIAVTVLLLISAASYFLFFNEKVSDNIEDEVIEITSLKLSILNGCGIHGAAGEVKDNIINKNFENVDIISCENVKSNKFIYGKSIIVVKKKDENKLKYLMKITGISRRIYALDDNTIEDFQIILGRDYRTYFK